MTCPFCYKPDIEVGAACPRCNTVSGELPDTTPRQRSRRKSSQDALDYADAGVLPDDWPNGYYHRDEDGEWVQTPHAQPESDDYSEESFP